MSKLKNRTAEEISIQSGSAKASPPSGYLPNPTAFSKVENDDAFTSMDIAPYLIQVKD